MSNFPKHPFQALNQALRVPVAALLVHWEIALRSGLPHRSWAWKTCLGLGLFAVGCTSAPKQTTLLPAERDTPRTAAIAARASGDIRPVSYSPLPTGQVARSARYSPSSSATASRPAGSPKAALFPTTLRPSTDGPLLDMLRPSNDRIWSPDQAELPYAEIHGDLVKVHNIRNAEYRTVDDYTVRYYDKIFDLRTIKSVDFIQVPFADTPAIAHVMLSFGFEGDQYVVLSVEIRKEKGEAYSAVKGFFNQYELMYVLADERDVIWKNSIGWQCEVYVWRTKATPEQARELFLDVMRRVNKLQRKPEFYNTITNNCTTNIRQHINHLVPDRVPYDYRVLLPGYSDKLAYDLGLLDTSLPYESARVKARVNYKAYLCREDADFSAKIRR
jgi:hypothetical protein